jgi:Icc-related predicted phosphoesterase
MKVAYCSDLHIERGTLELKNTENADVLILAGDIFVSHDLEEFNESETSKRLKHRSTRIHNFISDCCKEFPHVIMICGNHESYTSDILNTYTTISQFLKYNSNFHLLENDVVNINDIIFVGGTMWTNMNGENLETIHSISKMLNDFRIIRRSKDKFTPLDALDIFKETTDYIDLMSTVYSDKSIVVVTHHSPSFKSTDPRFKDETILNGGFCSDLDQFIEDRTNIKKWIHGHLHNKCDYMIGNCNILCNPRGYLGYEECANNFKLEYFEV